MRDISCTAVVAVQPAVTLCPGLNAASLYPQLASQASRGPQHEIFSSQKGRHFPGLNEMTVLRFHCVRFPKAMELHRQTGNGRKLLPLSLYFFVSSQTAGPIIQLTRLRALYF